MEQSLHEALIRRLALEQEVKTRSDDLEAFVRSVDQKRAQLDDDTRQRFVQAEQARLHLRDSIASTRERVVADLHDVAAAQRAAVEQMFLQERALRDQALVEVQGTSEKLLFAARAEHQAASADLLRAIEAEKAARLAAEGELRRLFAVRDAAAAKEADENKLRIERLDARQREDSASVKRTQLAAADKERQERAALEKRIRQSLEEFILRVQNDGRTAVDALAATLSAESSARQQQLSDLTQALQQEKDARLTAEFELKQLVDQQVVAVKEQCMGLQKTVEEAVRDAIAKRQALEQDMMARFAAVADTLNRHQQHQLVLAEDIQSRANAAERARLAGEGELHLQIAKVQATTSSAADDMKRDLTSRISKQADSQRAHLEEARAQCEQSLETAVAKFTAASSEHTARLEGFERIQQATNKELTSTIERERQSRAESLNSLQQALLASENSLREDAQVQRAVFEDQLRSEVTARTANIDAMSNDIKCVQDNAQQAVAALLTDTVARFATERNERLAATEQLRASTDAVVVDVRNSISELHRVVAEGQQREHDERESGLRSLSSGLRAESTQRLTLESDLRASLNLVLDAQKREIDAREDADAMLLENIGSVDRERLSLETALADKVEKSEQALRAVLEANKSYLEDKMKTEQQNREKSIQSTQSQAVEASRAVLIEARALNKEVAVRIDEEIAQRSRAFEDAAVRIEAVDVRHSESSKAAVVSLTQLEERLTQSISGLSDKTNRALSTAEQSRRKITADLQQRLAELGDALRAEETARVHEVAGVRRYIDTGNEANQLAVETAASKERDARTRLEKELRAVISSESANAAVTRRELLRQIEGLGKDEAGRRDTAVHTLQSRLEELQQTIAAERVERVEADEQMADNVRTEASARDKMALCLQERLLASTEQLQQSIAVVQKVSSESLNQQSAVLTAALNVETRRADDLISALRTETSVRSASLESAIADVTENASRAITALQETLEPQICRVGASERSAREAAVDNLKEVIISLEVKLRGEQQQDAQSLNARIDREVTERTAIVQQINLAIENETEDRIKNDGALSDQSRSQLHLVLEEASQAVRVVEDSVRREEATRQRLEEALVKRIDEQRSALRAEEGSRLTLEEQLRTQRLQEEQRRVNWEESIRANIDSEMSTVKETMLQTANNLRDRITTETSARAEAIQQSKEATDSSIARLRADAERNISDLSVRTDEDLRVVRSSVQAITEAVTREEGARRSEDSQLSLRVESTEQRARDALAATAKDIGQKLSSEERDRKQALRDARQAVDALGSALRLERETAVQDLNVRLANEAKTRDAAIAQQKANLQRAIAERTAAADALQKSSNDQLSQFRDEIASIRIVLNDLTRNSAAGDSHALQELHNATVSWEQELAEVKSAQSKFEQSLLQKQQHETESRVKWQQDALAVSENELTALRDSVRAELEKLSSQLVQESAARAHNQSMTRTAIESSSSRVIAELETRSAAMQDLLQAEQQRRTLETQELTASSIRSREAIEALQREVEEQAAQADNKLRDTAESFTAHITAQLASEQTKRMQQVQSVKEELSTLLSLASARYKAAIDELSARTAKEAATRERLLSETREFIQHETDARTAAVNAVKQVAENSIDRVRADSVSVARELDSAIKDEAAKRLALEKDQKNKLADLEKFIKAEQLARMQTDKDGSMRMSSEKQDRLQLQDDQRKALDKLQSDARAFADAVRDELSSKFASLERALATGEQRYLQRDDVLGEQLAREVRERTDRHAEGLRELNEIRRDTSLLHQRFSDMEDFLKSLSATQRAWEERVRGQLSEQSSTLLHVKEQTNVSSAIMDAKLLDMQQEVRLSESRIKQDVEHRILDLSPSPERQSALPRTASPLARGASFVGAPLERLGSARRFDSVDLDSKYDEWYQPEAPDDAVDVAVQKVLRSLGFPMRIHFKRLGPGLYMADRKLHVTLTNGHVLVRKGGGFEALYTYLFDLYAADAGMDVASRRTPQALTAPSAVNAAIASVGRIGSRSTISTPSRPISQ
eukprot:TRINITY_DN1128_c1_g2_i2.p1 TRINITY_DN1128_c1_g2~~TRINITY_DN1128_c1_g2_i2.p1  ORF type:complete len:2031 (+),score=565.36 TRINITY_DN1128_c1_g2_i2:497-6589(+)